MTTVTMAVTTPNFLYQAARREAEAYRRELADRSSRESGVAHGGGSGTNSAGDRADDAISEWNRLYWWQWACDRVLEHVRGDVYWAELDASRFAAWRNATRQFRDIADEIGRLRDALAGPLDELPFARRQAMEDRLAELVNRLLD